MFIKKYMFTASKKHQPDWLPSWLLALIHVGLDVFGLASFYPTLKSVFTNSVSILFLYICTPVSHMEKSYDLIKMAVKLSREMIALYACIFALISLVSSEISKRDIKVTPWPDCQKYNVCQIAEENGANVVYVKARSPIDSLLYVFSTIGTPSVLLTRVTGTDTDLLFDWTKLLNGSTIEDAITFSHAATVDYKIGLAFTRLIEYNDNEDSADLQEAEKKLNKTDWNIRNLNHFEWTFNTSEAGSTSFAFNSTSENDDMLIEGTSRNWSISFSFKVPEDAGRQSDLPSLKYGVNQTLFDFVISNYTPSFSHSRFALEAVIVSQIGKKNMDIETVQSIDDEYSPGVFQVVNWITDSANEDSGGFLQWKPVCYNKKDRSRSTATKVKHYDLQDVGKEENITGLLNSSVILAFFGKDLYNEKSVIFRASNISFGLSEDGFYLQNNYTAWTAALGYGSPPVDSISLTVIVTISAGLGLPVIILILGGVYSGVRKCKQRQLILMVNQDSVSTDQAIIN